jgi:Transcription mediator complex subunit Med12
MVSSALASSMPPVSSSTPPWRTSSTTIYADVHDLSVDSSEELKWSSDRVKYGWYHRPLSKRVELDGLQMDQFQAKRRELKKHLRKPVRQRQRGAPYPLLTHKNVTQNNEWIQDLAGETSFSDLTAAEVPHGFKKGQLLDTLWQARVPILRAMWFVKVVYLNTRDTGNVRQNRARSRTAAAPTVKKRQQLWTEELRDYMIPLAQQAAAAVADVYALSSASGTPHSATATATSTATATAAAAAAASPSPSSSNMDRSVRSRAHVRNNASMMPHTSPQSYTLTQSSSQRSMYHQARNSMAGVKPAPVSSPTSSLGTSVQQGATGASSVSTVAMELRHWRYFEDIFLWSLQEDLLKRQDALFDGVIRPMQKSLDELRSSKSILAPHEFAPDAEARMFGDDKRKYAYIGEAVNRRRRWTETSLRIQLLARCLPHIIESNLLSRRLWNICCNMLVSYQRALEKFPSMYQHDASDPSSLRVLPPAPSYDPSLHPWEAQWRESRTFTLSLLQSVQDVFDHIIVAYPAAASLWTASQLPPLLGLQLVLRGPIVHVPWQVPVDSDAWVVRCLDSCLFAARIAASADSSMDTLCALDTQSPLSAQVAGIHGVVSRAGHANTAAASSRQRQQRISPSISEIVCHAICGRFSHFALSQIDDLAQPFPPVYTPSPPSSAHSRSISQTTLADVKTPRYRSVATSTPHASYLSESAVAASVSTKMTPTSASASASSSSSSSAAAAAAAATRTAPPLSSTSKRNHATPPNKFSLEASLQRQSCCVKSVSHDVSNLLRCLLRFDVAYIDKYTQIHNSATNRVLRPWRIPTKQDSNLDVKLNLRALFALLEWTIMPARQYLGHARCLVAARVLYHVARLIGECAVPWYPVQSGSDRTTGTLQDAIVAFLDQFQPQTMNMLQSTCVLLSTLVQASIFDVDAFMRSIICTAKIPSSEKASAYCLIRHTDAKPIHAYEVCDLYAEYLLNMPMIAPTSKKRKSLVSHRNVLLFGTGSTLGTRIRKVLHACMIEHLHQVSGQTFLSQSVVKVRKANIWTAECRQMFPALAAFAPPLQQTQQQHQSRQHRVHLVDILHVAPLHIASHALRWAVRKFEPYCSDAIVSNWYGVLLVCSELLSAATHLPDLSLLVELQQFLLRFQPRLARVALASALRVATVHSLYGQQSMLARCVCVFLSQTPTPAGARAWLDSMVLPPHWEGPLTDFVMHTFRQRTARPPPRPEQNVPKLAAPALGDCIVAILREADAATDISTEHAKLQQLSNVVLGNAHSFEFQFTARVVDVCLNYAVQAESRIHDEELGSKGCSSARHVAFLLYVICSIPIETHANLATTLSSVICNCISKLIAHESVASNPAAVHGVVRVLSQLLGWRIVSPVDIVKLSIKCAPVTLAMVNVIASLLNGSESTDIILYDAALEMKQCDPTVLFSLSKLLAKQMCSVSGIAAQHRCSAVKALHNIPMLYAAAIASESYRTTLAQGSTPQQALWMHSALTAGADITSDIKFDQEWTQSTLDSVNCWNCDHVGVSIQIAVEALENSNNMSVLEPLLQRSQLQVLPSSGTSVSGDVSMAPILHDSFHAVTVSASTQRYMDVLSASGPTASIASFRTLSTTLEHNLRTLQERIQQSTDVVMSATAAEEQLALVVQVCSPYNNNADASKDTLSLCTAETQTSLDHFTALVTYLSSNPSLPESTRNQFIRLLIEQSIVLCDAAYAGEYVQLSLDTMLAWQAAAQYRVRALTQFLHVLMDEKLASRINIGDEAAPHVVLQTLMKLLCSPLMYTPLTNSQEKVPQVFVEATFLFQCLASLLRPDHRTAVKLQQALVRLRQERTIKCNALPFHVHDVVARCIPSNLLGLEDLSEVALPHSLERRYKRTRDSQSTSQTENLDPWTVLEGYSSCSLGVMAWNVSSPTS